MATGEIIIQCGDSKATHALFQYLVEKGFFGEDRPRPKDHSWYNKYRKHGIRLIISDAGHNPDYHNSHKKDDTPIVYTTEVESFLPELPELPDPIILPILGYNMVVDNNGLMVGCQKITLEQMEALVAASKAMAEGKKPDEDTIKILTERFKQEEEEEEEEEEVTTHVPGLVLEVGGIYENRNGDHVRIYEDDGHDNYPYNVRYQDRTEVYSVTRQGTEYSHKTTERDLMRRIS